MVFLARLLVSFKITSSLGRHPGFALFVFLPYPFLLMLVFWWSLSRWAMWRGNHYFSSRQRLLLHMVECRHSTNTKAEIVVAWALLFFATSLKISTLQVFGDISLKCVFGEMSSKGQLNVISLKFWMDHILELRDYFQNLFIRHILSVWNQQSDFLSKKALQKEEGSIFFKNVKVLILWEEVLCM